MHIKIFHTQLSTASNIYLYNIFTSSLDAILMLFNQLYYLLYHTLIKTDIYKHIQTSLVEWANQ